MSYGERAYEAAFSCLVLSGLALAAINRLDGDSPQWSKWLIAGVFLVLLAGVVVGFFRYDERLPRNGTQGLTGWRERIVLLAVLPFLWFALGAIVAGRGYETKIWGWYGVACVALVAVAFMAKAKPEAPPAIEERPD